MKVAVTNVLGVPYTAMAIVCLCNRVSDRRVRRCVDGGAETVDEVGAACGAGTTCGGCHDTIDDIIEVRRAGSRRLSVA